MKRVGVIVRERLSSDLKSKLGLAQACFFISFNKMGAFSLNVMRNKLKLDNSDVFVGKNTLLSKVFNEAGFSELNGFLSGETAIIIVHDKDIVKAAKTIVNFGKENEALQIRGGFLKDKRITADKLTTLAKLPAKEVLLGTVVSTLAAPITGFLSTLNQVVIKFLWTVEEIKKAKEKK